MLQRKSGSRELKCLGSHHEHLTNTDTLSVPSTTFTLTHHSSSGSLQSASSTTPREPLNDTFHQNQIILDLLRRQLNLEPVPRLSTRELVSCLLSQLAKERFLAAAYPLVFGCIDGAVDVSLAGEPLVLLQPGVGLVINVRQKTFRLFNTEKDMDEEDKEESESGFGGHTPNRKREDEGRNGYERKGAKHYQYAFDRASIDACVRLASHGGSERLGAQFVSKDVLSFLESAFTLGVEDKKANVVPPVPSMETRLDADSLLRMRRLEMWLRREGFAGLACWHDIDDFDVLV